MTDQHAEGPGPDGLSLGGSDSGGSNRRGSDPRGSDPEGSDPEGSDPVGSDPGGSDPVVAVQQWLTQRGLPVPDPGPQPVVVGPGGPRRRPGARASVPAADDPLGPAQPGADGDGDGERRASRRSTRPEARPGRGAGPVQRGAQRTAPGSDVELANPEETARGVVLRKLTGQARTRHELDQALKAKQVPEAVADRVLDRMEEVGLVDDAAFARDWVASRQQRRQLSRRALRHELQTKGVDRDQIEAALTTVDVDDEFAAALALARRKSRTMTDLPRDVRHRRLSGALARRGFSGTVVGQVLSQVLDDPDR